MKIVFVMPSLSGGGAERVVSAISSEMSRINGNEIFLLTYEKKDEKAYPIADTVHWHCADFDMHRSIARVWKRVLFFRKKIRDIGPDCVISLGGPAVITVLTLAMIKLGIPLVLSERNDPQRYPVSRILRFLRTAAYTLADGVVFQTTGAKAFFSNRIQKKGIVITNPLMQDLPNRCQEDIQPKIVTFCRLTPQKNLDLLIDAFSDISNDFPEYNLYIYGDGEERTRLEEKVKLLGLQQRVIFGGYSNCVHNEIKNAAMYVLTSNYEGISNSMLEAIAMGIPSVCTDCPPGGAREIIQDGVNGILIPVGGRHELEVAMRRLLQDAELSGKISEAGSTLKDRLSVERITKQWITYIERVIADF